MAQDRLEFLEEQLQRATTRFGLDHVLLLVREALNDARTPGTRSHNAFSGFPGGLVPFMTLPLIDFAMRFGVAGREEPTWDQFVALLELSHDYALEDPIGCDPEITAQFHGSDPTFLLLRLLDRQWFGQREAAGSLARCKLLWQDSVDATADLAGRYDIRSRFALLFGVSWDDYFAVGLHAQDLARQHARGFTRRAFRDRRADGYKIPADPEVTAILSKFTADPAIYSSEYERRRPWDERFRMYTPSPLFRFPLLRPWTSSDRKGNESEDRLLAPIWSLVAKQISDAPYLWLKEYDQRNRRRFCSYFGHVLSAYLGMLLRATYGSDNVWNVDEFWKSDGDDEQHPDWLVLDRANDQLLIFECKAGVFPTLQLLRSDEEAFRQTLRDKLIKGGSQCETLRRAIVQNDDRLPTSVKAYVRPCASFVVTFERFPTMNGPAGKKYLELAADEPIEGKWWVLALDELEALQPYLEEGTNLAGVLGEQESVWATVRRLSDERPDALEGSYIGRVAGDVLKEYLGLREPGEERDPPSDTDVREGCLLCLMPFDEVRVPTIEHVIPEALWNDNYTVDGVCSACNQFMAHSFEGKFNRGDFTRDLKETMCPPSRNTRAFRRKVVTESGDEVHIYVNGDSYEPVMPPVVREESSSVTFDFQDRNGCDHRYTMELPFGFPTKIEGSPTETNRKLTRAQRKLQGYVDEVWADPAKNEMFAAYLGEHGIEIDSKAPPSVPVRSNTGSETRLMDKGIPLSQETEIPMEDTLRFFAKIAWLHLWSEFGEEGISNPVARELRGYLVSGEVPRGLALRLAESDQKNWVRSQKIGGQEVFFWNERSERILKALNLVTLPADLVDEVRDTTCQRISEQRRIIRLFAGDMEAQAVDVRPRRQELAFHEVSFTDMMPNRSEIPYATWVKVKLFGGLFEVCIRVSNETFTHGADNTRMIDFLDRVPPPPELPKQLNEAVSETDERDEER